MPRRGRVHRQVDLLKDTGGHAVQQLSFAAKVPVESHGRHAELLGQPPDRDRLKPFHFGERERIFDHRLRSKGDPVSSILATFPSHLLTIVHCTGILRTCTVYRCSVEVRYESAHTSGFVRRSERRTVMSLKRWFYRGGHPN